MASFSVVAPIQILQELRFRAQFGHHHLLLAHDVVKHPNEYATLFPPFSAVKVILDNSAAELNAPVDVKMIIEAARICNPTCIALPDFPLDMEKTIEATKEALQTWPTLFKKQHPWMYIPQGKTIQEFAKAATAFVGDRHIKWWGVPRNLVKQIGSRRDAINLCRMLQPSRAIHLLGFSDNMVDDLLCSQNHHVSSIDSAVPLRVREPFGVHLEVGPRGDWWETGECDSLTVSNLKYARTLFQH